MDWHEWHDAYDTPDSYLGRRLALVQSRVRLALDDAPPGPLTAVSVCAGQGRDLIGVLAEHPRRGDVRTAGFCCAPLCRPGGTLVWTRHRKAPDLVPRVCGWLEERGFERLWVSDPALGFGVGAHRYAGEPRRLPSGERMFTFVGYDRLG